MDSGTWVPNEHEDVQNGWKMEDGTLFRNFVFYLLLSTMRLLQYIEFSKAFSWQKWNLPHLGGGSVDIVRLKKSFLSYQVYRVETARCMVGTTQTHVKAKCFSMGVRIPLIMISLKESVLKLPAVLFELIYFVCFFFQMTGYKRLLQAGKWLCKLIFTL